MSILEYSRVVLILSAEDVFVFLILSKEILPRNDENKGIYVDGKAE